jgi:hypothetical protein
MENLESLDFSNNISEEKLTMLLIDSGYLTGKIQRTANRLRLIFSSRAAKQGNLEELQLKS